VTPSVEFTEEMFWRISDLMLERVGYRPGFIAVITEDNCDTALDTVRLAKRMGVECKINYAVASGSQQSTPFLLGRVYKIYLDIFKAGLAEWEFNTKQMSIRVKGIPTLHTVCPLTRDCDLGIRNLNPNGTYYSCGAFGDDHFEDKGKYAIDFKKEVLEGGFYRPLKEQYDLQAMKSECYTCPMFQICNGCYKTVKDYKRLGVVEEHCALMKANAPEILAMPVFSPDNRQLATPHVDSP